MELRRRFAFRGNAAAFGGRIVRPEDVVLEMPGASSLGIVGGRSVSNINGTPKSFKDFVTFKSASTFAEGLFDDLKGLIALSNHQIAEDSLKSSTRVKAEIRALTVGRKKRLTAERLSAEMLSHSPTGSGEPPIALGDVAVTGVKIDGFELTVTLETGIFNDNDTRAKLLTAADTPAFVKKYGQQHLFMRTALAGQREAPPTGRLVAGTVGGYDTIYATIVKSIKWRSKPNPDATIDHHSVIVKDFGIIYFGELYISSSSRRLTMMRLELGSDEGGSAGGPDVDVNGGWWP
jgi:hypothetical protein